MLKTVSNAVISRSFRVASSLFVLFLIISLVGIGFGASDNKLSSLMEYGTSSFNEEILSDFFGNSINTGYVLEFNDTIYSIQIMPDFEDFIAPQKDDSYGYYTMSLTDNSSNDKISGECESQASKTQNSEPLDVEGDIVSGISSIYFEGLPSPLWVLDSIPKGIASGDEDTSPCPSLVVASSGFGSGRVIAVGSDGFVTNNMINLYDNKNFGNNVVDWLDKQKKKKIIISLGHGEWYGGSNLNLFKDELQNRGYSITHLYSPITSSELSDKGVLIIGNAWQPLSLEEINAIKDYVSNGGGLLLVGLGWSWEGYHPEKTIDDYPMNQIGQNFGIRWIGGVISDPTNNYNSGPIFHTFYPNVEIQTINEAKAYLHTTTNQYLDGLPFALQSDVDLRSKYVRATLILATGSSYLSKSDPQRQEIYNFYKVLFDSYPSLYQKDRVYNKNTESTMAYVRERSYSTLVNTQIYGDGLSSQEKAEIASSIGLSGKYLDIWNSFSVLLLDNTQLSSRQKDFLFDYLNSLPEGMHDLHSISVLEFLGYLPPGTPDIFVWTKEGGVNIFGIEIGKSSENPFPNDVSPVFCDLFCSAVVHEIDHVVDTYNCRTNPNFANRLLSLVSRAGCPQMNYLRSMVPDCYFLDHPQEFFASISNQYFCDSGHTLELGVVRFQNGYKEPINQFLFFADAYSKGSGHTYFYQIDTQGSINKESVPLIRDLNGYITSITYNGNKFDFELDSQGYVTKIEVAPASIWTGLGGYSTSLPSMIVDDQGRTHIFVRGGDGALWDNIDGVWYRLGGGISSAPFAVKDNYGRIHVLARGDDSALWNLRFDTGAWSASWYYMGGCIAEMPTATQYWGTGSIVIMTRACDDTLWALDLVDPAGMSGYWIGLGGSIRGVPYVMEDANGWILHTFSRGADNALWDHVISSPGYPVYPTFYWYYLGGGLSTGQVMPTAVNQPGLPSYVSVMVQAPDNALWMCDLWPDMSAHWYRLGGVIGSGGYAVTDSLGRIHTFAKGADGAAWENVFSSSPWNPSGAQWHYQGGGLHSMAWHPAAIANGYTQMALVGSDSALYKKVYPTMAPLVAPTEEDERTRIESEPSQPKDIRIAGDVSEVAFSTVIPVEIVPLEDEVATMMMKSVRSVAAGMTANGSETVIGI